MLTSGGQRRPLFLGTRYGCTRRTPLGPAVPIGRFYFLVIFKDELHCTLAGLTHCLLACLSGHTTRLAEKLRRFSPDSILIGCCHLGVRRHVPCPLAASRTFLPCVCLHACTVSYPLHVRTYALWVVNKGGHPRPASSVTNISSVLWQLHTYWHGKGSSPQPTARWRRWDSAHTTR
jgi:hypothetical protein